MSPTPTNTPPTDVSTLRNKYTPTPIIDGESLDTDDEDEGDDQPARSYKRQGTTSKHNHPRSPYRATVTKNVGGKTNVPFPSRSHHSLPPPPRPHNASTHSLGRTSTITERERNYSQGQTSVAAERRATQQQQQQQRPAMLKKLKKNEHNGNPFGDSVAPHQLPEDLRICLEVIDGGVFDGHKRLSEALRKRYDDQYPLVRSLADVFVSNVRLVYLPFFEFRPICFRPTSSMVMPHMSCIWKELLSRSMTLSITSPPKSPRSKTWLNGTKSVNCCKSSKRTPAKRVRQVSPSVFQNPSNGFLNILCFSKISFSIQTQVPLNTNEHCKWLQR